MCHAAVFSPFFAFVYYRISSGAGPWQQPRMIIFNHNLLFLDEPGLGGGKLKSELETISVMEEPALLLFQSFVLRSGWVDLSGQKARYYSILPFKEADKNFSWALEIKGVVSLVWDAKERKIIYRKGEAYHPERLRFWVFHTFLPLVLELERSCHILHVGSVEIEGKPVLFSAFSYGGKSTMTDYFIRHGHTLLSDDSLAIEKRDDAYYAIPSYPFHRPFRKLETLGYPVADFATEPKPLHAVFLLKESEPDTAVTIEELRGIEKFKAFHYSTLINFDFMKKERFAFFAELSKSVPVYRVTVPWDMERLDEVYKKIVDYSTKG